MTDIDTSLPDFLNVRLTRSTEQLEAIEAGIRRQILDDRNRRTNMKQPAPGSKLDQIRNLPGRSFTSPVGRSPSQTRREAGHGKPGETEADTAETVATKARQARRVMSGAAKALGLTTAPRSDTVMASTIEQTGVLTAGLNLDAQAAKESSETALSTSAASVEDNTKAPATAEGSTQAHTGTQENDTMKTATKAKAKTTKGKAKAKTTARRAVKSTAARAPKAKSDKATMVDQIIKLAQREKGATVAELNTLSGWKGCPWKWQFSNKKDTGWCQRRGLTFKVGERDDGTTAYYVGPDKAE